jgi:hypothetical protein
MRAMWRAMVFCWAAYPGSRSLVLSLPRRPFGDDTQAAGEPTGFHGSPQRGAVLAAIGPCRLKLRQKRIE